MAQLGARFHGMEEVIGSIPIRSTNKLFRMRRSPFLADGLPECNGADDGVESGALTARISGIKWT